MPLLMVSVHRSPVPSVREAPWPLGVCELSSGYLGLAIGQEEVGSTLVFGRACAVDKELHVHTLLLLLIHPSDALPKNIALTPGPTTACQACPLGGHGRTSPKKTSPASPAVSSEPRRPLWGLPSVRWWHAHRPTSTYTPLWLAPWPFTLRSPLRPENQTCM